MAQQQINTPLTGEEFARAVIAARKGIPPKDGSIDLALAEITVWANHHRLKSSFSPLGSFKLFVTAMNPSFSFSSSSAITVLQKVHPIHAALYAVLFKQYNEMEYLQTINNLYATAPAKHKANFQLLCEVFETQWLAASAAPLETQDLIK